ncbi:MAG: twin-arginine translocation signal domain-containing protein, partial [Actinobacteria bacterium]|nr:twin-arginine translocation signal domain-containing protein [Actinomycetota bacterium]
MAITRREFVTRLGALAAAAGLSQSQLLKITEAMGHSPTWGTETKPKVIWVHGAECTGCSVSLLSLFEDVRGLAVQDTRLTGGPVSTLAALDLAVGGDGDGGHVLPRNVPQTLVPRTNPAGEHHHRRLWNAGADFDGAANNTPFVANIADVLIDFISLEYHMTVMGMGGDQAYQWLKAEMARPGPTTPFVLVVEGAVQVDHEGGFWKKPNADVSGNDGPAAPWCAVGENLTGTEIHRFDNVVRGLASRDNCLAVVSLGQCSSFGGFPACVSPNPEFRGEKQTPAFGVHDYLVTYGTEGSADKVINVPGCPPNPWWFILSVVLWLADAVNGPLKAVPTAGPLGILDHEAKILPGSVDDQRRLKAVYGQSIHGPACSRYAYSFSAPGRSALYAMKPGDPGCLAMLGCKGLST